MAVEPNINLIFVFGAVITLWAVAMAVIPRLQRFLCLEPDSAWVLSGILIISGILFMVGHAPSMWIVSNTIYFVGWVLFSFAVRIGILMKVPRHKLRKAKRKNDEIF